MDVPQQGRSYLDLDSRNIQQYRPKGAPVGLFVIPNWLSEKEEQDIVDFLSKGQWSSHLSQNRPTQHFGYRYEIRGYSSSTEKVASDWGVLREQADRIEQQFPGVSISQCLANLYFRHTTIGAHRDKETPMVFGLSVVGDINMIWTEIANPNNKYEAFIPKRSVYIMSSDVALLWKHEIPARKTIKYPDQNGNLTQVVKKPDDYIRVSITYRHFANTILPEQQIQFVNKIMNDSSSVTLEMKVNNAYEQFVASNQNYLPPILTSAVQEIRANLPPKQEEKQIEACHLQNIIPNHKENYQKLFNEHPWQKWKSRFGAELSRSICGESNIVSRTSAIYAEWVKLFCQNVLGVKIELGGAFANYYPHGKATLPAHRDQYILWVFGLSFGETRTFDFIPNGTKSNVKRDTGIISIVMNSGDIVLFSPKVNDDYKHRILAEPKRTGPRINLTYFISVLAGEDERKMINPPEIRQEAIPTFEQAEIAYMQNKDKGVEKILKNSGLSINKDQFTIIQDDTGKIYGVIDGVMISFGSVEEAVASYSQSLAHQ
jgi:alkylated DNA repair dioxygenase AlkB